jgi:hypothetical protein
VKGSIGVRAAVAVLAMAAPAAAAADSVFARAPHFAASIAATTHRPAAGARWAFVVRVLDARGRPVPASALVRVLVGGATVDTIGMFGFRGTLRRSYTWPSTLRAAAATVEARVRGPDGTRTVAYAVRVRAISGRPSFRPEIDGASRSPAAGRPWSYVVRGADAAGRGIRGTAVVRVLVRGRVVDTVGWFSFNGALHRTYRWSPSLRGRQALLQASVVGPGGTHTVGYAVRVR